LCCRRILIVLDDVDKWYQFNAIVCMQNWLFQGSKITVTTRNKASIVADGERVKCKVEPLVTKNHLSFSVGMPLDKLARLKIF